MTLGIATVGRPNNSTGGDLLVDLLWDWQGQIVVMGENDQREPKMPGDMKHAADCKGCQFCWPGKFGAETVAKVLRENLPKPQPRISIRYPVSKAKDLRSWLNKTLRCPENPQACARAGNVFLTKLGVRGRA